MRGAFVRTFEDFVRTVKGHGTLMVELKVPGAAASGIEEQAVGIIQKVRRARLGRPQLLQPARALSRETDRSPRPHLLHLHGHELERGTAGGDQAEDRVDLPWPLQREFIRRAIRKIVRPDLLSINHAKWTSGSSTG